MSSNNINIVAAIVLGSSKITGIVGTKEIDGSIRVKAHVAQTSSDFIGKGRVLNVEKMINCLNSIKSRLEEQASCKIKCYYVGIGCLGLRSVFNEVVKQFPSVEAITDTLLTSIDVNNKEGKPNGRDIVEAIPLEYRLGSAGSIVTHAPRGMQTDYLQAKFLNITCNTNTISTLAACFRRAGIELADGRFHISAKHLASVLTTEQERTSGCAIVDLGSETTTVSVFRGKLLRHLVVIPLGSNSITRDIENVFYVEREEAEHLKRTHGYPIHKDEDDKREINLRDGGRTKKFSELTDIIDARVEEIVQNVKHQLELSQLSPEKLVNGIYVTGGGAQMKNILIAFQNNLKDYLVRVAKTSHLKVASSERKFNDDGVYNTALGLIFNADTNCYGGEYHGMFEPEVIAEVTEEIVPVETEEQRKAKEEAAARAEAEAARIAAEEAAARAKQETETEKDKKKGSKIGSFFRGVAKTFKDMVTDEEV